MSFAGFFRILVRRVMDGRASASDRAGSSSAIRSPVVRAGVIAPACLVGLGFIAFAPALSAGFTFWDDNIYVTQNPLVWELTPQSIWRVATTFSNCNYHPLTYLSYMIEYALFGAAPWVYHLTNVLLHIASSILVYFLVVRWIRFPAAALGGAILFSLHPLRAESVAWVAERKDCLSTFFFLVSVLAYVRYRDTQSARWYWWSLGGFVLALLAKVMAITLPAVLVLVLLARRECRWSTLRPILPFGVLSIVFAVMGVLAQSQDGAVKGLHGGSWGHHLLSVPVAVSFYAEKWLWPELLSPRYVLEPVTHLGDPRVLVGLALAAGAAILAGLSWRRRRIVFLGVGFAALTWAPVSGIVPTSTLVADRYTYLPSVGLSVLAALVIAAVAILPRRAETRPALGSGIAVALALLLVPATYAQSARWHDGMTLWTSALRENELNPFAHNQLSVELLFRERYEEAATAAERAAELGLRGPEYDLNLALAYRGLGDHERELEVARALEREYPDSFVGSLISSRIAAESGRHSTARSILDAVAVRFPNEGRILEARGNLLALAGRYEEAWTTYLDYMNSGGRRRAALLGAAVVLARADEPELALDVAEMALGIPGEYFWLESQERLDELKQLYTAEALCSWSARAETLSLPETR